VVNYLKYSQREHELAIAFAQADIASSDEKHEPDKLEMFEIAYQKALEEFRGKYPDFK